MITGVEWIIIAFLVLVVVIVVVVLLLTKLLASKSEEKEVYYPTRICPKCGRNLSQLPDDIKNCPYCSNELA